MEDTIEQVHQSFRAGTLTARQLVQVYLDRIAAYDQQGPKINCVINVNPRAPAEADRLDAMLKRSGFAGALHGIPVLLKDQIDVAGLPTTLGSVVFKNYAPVRDAFVVEKLKKAGAIILAKMTLGELGAGDCYGSLFGETRNPYALLRTVGGSSGGTAAGITANFGLVGIGQEGLASIRRPAAWNSIVGMRPTAGLVSRSGVWSGWPAIAGSLGPMTRTVTDLAKLLDVMVGYDPDDPITALGVGHVPESYTTFLHENGLHNARIGILREPMGYATEPDSDDFKRVTAVFDQAVEQLRAAGAEAVDPVVIPRLSELLAKRASKSSEEDECAVRYLSRNPSSPFKTPQDIQQSPDFHKVFRRRPGDTGVSNSSIVSDDARYYEYLEAREELTVNVMKLMADYELDAIVHKSVEHTPTLIKDGIHPPYVNQKGAPHLNTFLVYAAAITVPAGFTPAHLPVGITFFGRPYSEPAMIRLAYAFEQATRHRVPPLTTPAQHHVPRIHRREQPGRDRARRAGKHAVRGEGDQTLCRLQAVAIFRRGHEAGHQRSGQRRLPGRRARADAGRSAALDRRGNSHHRTRRRPDSGTPPADGREGNFSDGHRHAVFALRRN
jgi:Asp-tRNA(Asn)/Glu-tRNA(Gln) amidotransferase A subunit family amidase